MYNPYFEAILQKLKLEEKGSGSSPPAHSQRDSFVANMLLYVLLSKLPLQQMKSYTKAQHTKLNEDLFSKSQKTYCLSKKLCTWCGIFKTTLFIKSYTGVINVLQRTPNTFLTVQLPNLFYLVFPIT